MAQSSHRQGVLERWARFAHRRRGLVISLWVAALIILVVAGQTLGGTFSSQFRLPGSESQRAYDLLKDRFPQRSGSTADIVFEAPAGVAAPEVRQRVEALFAEVRQVEGVVGIDSPYDQPRYVSKDGTIARADVLWAKRAQNTDRASIERFIALVDAASGDGLRFETGGSIVEHVEHPKFGSEFYGLAAAVVILLIAFGSVIAMGLPVGAAVFGLGTGFSVIALAANFGPFPQFSPQFAAMIGLGVGIDYSLLVVTRFREGLHHGHSVEESLVLAVNTSGRSVVFAGLVVAIAFLGLFAMGLPFVAAVGTAGALVVLVSVLVAVTLLPSLLSFAGTRVDRWKVPFLHTTEGVDVKSGWYRLSVGIQKRPLPFFVGTAVLLVALGAPVFSMRLGFPDAGTSPEHLHSRRAYDLITKGFGAGANGPLLIVVDGANGGGDGVERVQAAVRATSGIALALPARLNAAGDTALMTVLPTTAPQAPETIQLVHRLRDRTLPGAVAGSPMRAFVGGQTAGMIDVRDRITDRMPLLFGGVIGLSFLTLMVVFRSVLVALKAAVMNIFSIGASYGVLVAVFQWGWFSNVLGVEKGSIETFLPMMLFAILFGLSMDYEVFLISRIREEYVRTGHNATAVSHGLAATARVITAAAAIMVTVFLTFVFGEDRVIKEFGLGLATAIFVDATIVRLILVPATMELLGDANWWLPRWLARILPMVHLEAPPDAPLPGGSPAGGE